MADNTKWNLRRLELLSKSELTPREKQELRLMEKCVNYNSPSTATIGKWQRSSLREDVIFLQKTIGDLRKTLVETSQLLGVEVSDR